MPTLVVGMSCSQILHAHDKRGHGTEPSLPLQQPIQQTPVVKTTGVCGNLFCDGADGGAQES